MGALNLEGDSLGLLSAGEQNEWRGLGLLGCARHAGKCGLSLAVGQFSHRLGAGWGPQRRGSW